MIQIYRKLMTDDHLFTQKEITVGSWIHLTAPTEQEICEVSKKLDLEPDFFIRILDDEGEKRSAIEKLTVKYSPGDKTDREAEIKKGMG